MNTPRLQGVPPAEGGNSQAGRLAPAGFHDELGERSLSFDPASETIVETLHLRREFSDSLAFDGALRARVAKVGRLSSAGFANVQAVERTDKGLVLISKYASGRRLSELGSIDEGARVAFDVIRRITPALAVLHEATPGCGHGALSLNRIVMTRDKRLIVVEHVLASAFEALHWSRPRFNDLGLVVPDAVPVRLDERTDLRQLGWIVLSLLLGRVLPADEYPGRAAALLAEATRTLSVMRTTRLGEWLGRTLQITPGAYANGQEAAAAFAEFAGDPALEAAEEDGALMAFPSEETAETQAPVPVLPPRAASPEVAAAPQVVVPDVSDSPDVVDEPDVVVANKVFVASKPAPTPASKPAPTPAPVPAAPALRPVDRAPKLQAVQAPPIVVAPPAGAPVAPPAPAPAPAAAPAPAPAAAPFRAAAPAVSNPQVLVRREWISRDVAVWAGGALLVISLAQAVAIISLLTRPAVVVAPPPEQTVQTLPSVPVVDGATADAGTPPTTNAPAPAPPPAGVTRPGSIALQSPIELEILRDNAVVGSSSNPLYLPNGQHTLMFANRALGFRTTQVVNVISGQVTRVRVPIPNMLVSVNAVPWADVTIDGVGYGQTPLANVSLTVGSHEFVFRHPDLGERRQTVLIRADTPNRVTQNFR